MCSKTTIFALLLITVAVLYQYYKLTSKNDTKSYRRRNLDEKIAIGLNADVDYIISAVELLTSLNAVPGEIRGDHLTLNTVDELQQTIAYSMDTCSGIERHFNDKVVFDQIVEASSKLKHEEFVGGNAALIANKIKQLSPNSEILLVAPVGTKIQQYLSQSIETISPPNTSEEIHIILEYSKGEKWGEVTATCANRVIISHDIANSQLVALNIFNETLNTYDPSLVILSGLHMLDGQPQNVWLERLTSVADTLKRIPRTVPVHLEMATVGNLKFLPHLADTIFPYIDSLGLNEQELVSLVKSKQGDFDFNEIGPKPSITDASDLLHWLYQEYSILDRHDSRLSRVHFHSLSFHIILQPRTEMKGVEWSNGLEAVMRSSKMVSLQACDSQQINSVDFEIQIPNKYVLSRSHKTLSKSVIENTISNGYAAWQRDSIDYYLAPVYVCKSPMKTVGLGDAISAVGLLESKFKFTKRKLKTKRNK